MGQQEYDFFGTSQPSQSSRPAPGAPEVPEVPLPAAPPRRSHQYGVDPMGRAVNQFGTPIDEAAVPVGPAAAPGYGAQAWHGAGLTGDAGWNPPPTAHRPPPGARRVDPSVRPPTVLAAGIVAIVQGVLAAIVALLGFAAVSVLESSVAQLQGSGVRLTAEVSGFVRLVLFLVLAVGALYLVAGIGCAVGRRWAAWTLLVVEAVGLVLGIIGLLDSSTQAGGALGQLVGLAVPVAVLVLLVVPRSWAWLQSR